MNKIKSINIWPGKILFLLFYFVIYSHSYNRYRLKRQICLIIHINIKLFIQCRCTLRKKVYKVKSLNMALRSRFTCYAYIYIYIFDDPKLYKTPQPNNLFISRKLRVYCPSFWNIISMISCGHIFFVIL